MELELFSQLNQYSKVAFEIIINKYTLFALMPPWAWIVQPIHACCSQDYLSSSMMSLYLKQFLGKQLKESCLSPVFLHIFA